MLCCVWCGEPVEVHEGLLNSEGFPFHRACLQADEEDRHEATHALHPDAARGGTGVRKGRDGGGCLGEPLASHLPVDPSPLALGE